MLIIEVSVIIVTYNSCWEKIKLTLLSVLKQKNISLQIVIADDGSKEVMDGNINQLMKQFNFENYIIADNCINRGTVLNIASVLKYLTGMYTKIIAPGDYFYEENTLCNWVEYMKTEDARVSFGEAVYYENYPSMRFIESKGSPVNKMLFKKNTDDSNSFIDYVVANDTILGAAQLMKTDILKEYIQLISNRIVYAEDYMVRIMVFDGLKIYYYPKVVVMYEYGTGISTSKNKKWSALLKHDFEVSNEIISQRKATSSVRVRFQKYLRQRNSKFNKLVKVVFFPQMLIYRFKMKFAKTYIPIGADSNKAKWV